MSIIPKQYRAIEPTPVQGEWIAWQIMGSRGPGRWSNRHYTLGTMYTLCGKRIPPRQQMFRCEINVGENICPACERRVKS